MRRHLRQNLLLAAALGVLGAAAWWVTSRERAAFAPLTTIDPAGIASVRVTTATGAPRHFERGFIAFASVLALTTLVLGVRRHGNFRAFWFLAPGIVLLTAGIIVDFDDNATLHAVLVAIGGTLVALAHLTNLRLGHVHVHVHDAACCH